MDKAKTKMNWNTLLITANMAIIGLYGHTLVNKIEATHDAVVTMNVQIADIRSRQTATDADVASIKVNVAALTLEFAKWKERHP